MIWLYINETVTNVCTLVSDSWTFQLFFFSISILFIKYTIWTKVLDHLHIVYAGTSQLWIGHEAPDTQFLCRCWFRRQFVAHYSMKIFPHYAPQHSAVLLCNFMTSGISWLFTLPSSSMFNILYLIYPLLHMSKPFQLCLINLVSKPELSLLYILILSMLVIPSESGSFPEFSIFYLVTSSLHQSLYMTAPSNPWIVHPRRKPSLIKGVKKVVC